MLERTPMPRRHRPGVKMRLHTGAGGRGKASMALKEIKSNEEPFNGGGPIQILLPSLPDLADRIHHRIYRCIGLA